MKNVLVTGGAGFIGYHVTKALLKTGYTVTVIDNLSTGYQDIIDPRIHFIKGDITHPDILEKALKNQDAVIHMAGLIVVPESVTQPLSYFHTNMYGGLILLEAMRKNKVKKIIFSSSAAVYGNPQTVPIDENDLKTPLSPYGATKLAFEAFLSSYAQSYGMDCIALRYFNAYGPFERHKPETHAIPLFIKAILNQQPITITGSIKQIRDYVYVEDIARAHVEALTLSEYQALNLGSGKGVSLEELVQTLEVVFKKKIPIQQAPPRPGDTEKLIAKIDKIQQTLGWHPVVALNEGLTKTVAYFKKYL